MADNQSIIGKGVIFKGKISNATTLEINGRVEADIKSEKVTVGKHANLEGSINSELVVIHTFLASGKPAALCGSPRIIITEPRPYSE